MKKLSIKRIAPATVMTVITLTPSLSPLRIEAENFSRSDLKSMRALASVMAFQKPITSSAKETSFQFSDWDYQETDNQIILTKYKGSNLHVVIPGEVSGKQVVLENFLIFPRGLKSLSLQDVNGQKVGIQTTSLEDAFVPYPYLTTLDLNGLDVSSVTSLKGAFRSLTFLKTLHIEEWETGKVKDMSYLFHEARSLTELSIGHWDTSSVEDMSWMFGLTGLTALDLNQWEMSKVKDLSAMFYGAANLTSLEISKWETSAVQNMSHLFQATTRLKRVDLQGWETSNVQSLAYAFANSGIESLEIGTWDVSKVETLEGAFSQMMALTRLDLNQWQTTHLENLTQTFKDSKALTELNIGDWEVSHVQTMNGAFEGLESLTRLELGKWRTNALTSLKDTFKGMSQLQTLNVSGWTTDQVVQMNSTFQGVSQLKTLDLRNWETSNVQTMQGMFKGMKSLTSLEVGHFDTSKVTNLSAMFHGVSQLKTLDLRGWDTANVTDMSYLFYGMKSLVELQVEHFQVYRVKTMRSMFEGVSQLETLDLNQWITTNVNDLSYTFAGMRSLKDLKISNWRTSRVTTMQGLFQGVERLTQLNLKGWDTSKVTNMSELFYGMKGLQSLDIKHFKTSQVTVMQSMFYGMSQVKTLDLSGWDTSRLNSTSYQFYGMDQLQLLNLSGWNVADVKADQQMFGVETPTPFVVITTDSRLKQYDYQADQRIGIEMTFEAAGGQFKGGNSTLNVNYPVVFEQLDEATMAQSVQHQLQTVERPTRDQCQFKGWKSQVVEESLTGLEALKGSYQATWQCEFSTFMIKTNPTGSTTAIYGTGEPGAKVKAFVDGQAISSLVEVNVNGNYKIVIPKQKAGTIIQVKMAKEDYRTVSKRVTVLDEFKTFTLKESPTASTTAIYGTGVPGAKVGIYTQAGQRLAITTVNSKGNFKLVIPKQETGTVLTLKQAKSGYITLSKEIKVLNQFKTLTVQNVSSTTTAVYGMGEPGASVRAYVNGKAISSLGTVNNKGNFKLVIPKQKAGTVVEIKMAKEGYLTIATQTKVLKALTIFTHSTVKTSSTTINGKGVVGAKVGVYTSNGKRLAITTVNSKGTYKLPLPKQKVGTKLVIKQAKSGYLTLSKNVTVIK